MRDISGVVCFLRRVVTVNMTLNFEFREREIEYTDVLTLCVWQ